MVKPRDIIFHPVHFLSLGLGSGLSPFAPGTAGTLVAVLLYIPLSMLPLWGYVVILITGSLIGIYLCQETTDRLGVKDHPAIVWDEFLGYWLTMFMAPAGWIWIVAGFLLFRLFDIWKPWPVSVIDHKVRGGLGIMLDDLFAGAYALVILQLINYLYKQI
ncbi:MAG: phosphatidylglycerophosphatase A [Gammaproteobacteria bacterium]|nr:phosphatidylglycerophosphatase A [Gammaproteobacteria bacterium]